MAAFSSAGAGCEYMLINHFNLNIFKLIHKVNGEFYENLFMDWGIW